MTQHDTIDALARYMERHDTPYVSYHGLAEGIVGRFGVVELPAPAPSVERHRSAVYVGATWIVRADQLDGITIPSARLDPTDTTEARAFAAALLAAIAYVDDAGLCR